METDNEAATQSTPPSPPVETGDAQGAPGAAMSGQDGLDDRAAAPMARAVTDGRR